MYDYVENTYCASDRSSDCNAENIIDTTQSIWSESDRYYLDNAKQEHMDLISEQLRIPNKLLCRLSIKYVVAPALNRDLDPEQECDRANP